MVRVFRAIYNSHGAKPSLIGKTGVVKVIINFENSLYAGVRFDENIDGNDLCHYTTTVRCEPGYGRYIRLDELEHYKDVVTGVLSIGDI